MVDVLTELALVLIITSFVSVALFFLRQPILVAYVLSGVLLGPTVLALVHPTQALEDFASLGIALLLFILGLSLNPKILKEMGRVSLFVGLGQVVATTALCFAVALSFGFTHTEALFLGIAFSFSSTIIIVKLLSDKGELNALHGRLAVGILLLQDLVAVFLLGVIGAGSQGLAMPLAVVLLASGLVLLVNKFLAPKVVGVFAKSQELLFLFALAWCFAWAAGLKALGFSLEIGALMAGVSLSGTLYSQEISNKVKPLRDFFIVLFFILLGSRLDVGAASSLVLPAIVFSAIVLVGKPLITMALLRLNGYGKQVGFNTSLPMGQISEFSLLFLFLVSSKGLVSPGVIAVSTAVALATLLLSSYLINFSKKVFSLTGKFLNAFEAKRDVDRVSEKEFDSLLVGYRRSGYSIAKTLQLMGANTLVVDVNPEVAAQLKKEDLLFEFADAEDEAFLESLPKGLKYAVSTVSSPQLSALLLKYVRKKSPKAVVVLTSESVQDAISLYGKGADYVIVPRLASGAHLSYLLGKNKYSQKEYAKEKEKHLKVLNAHLAKGFDY